jgi:hypothetical protein
LATEVTLVHGLEVPFMQQDHVESRAEEKSAGAPARAKASPDLTSQARAVLNLQHTAGNRAMARILAPSAQPVPLQRAAVSPVTVQRDELLDELRKAYGSSEDLPLERLAHMIVAPLRGSDRQPVEGSEKASDTAKTKKKESDPTKLAEKAKKSADAELLSSDELANKRTSLEEKEKALRERPEALDDQQYELGRREKRLKLDKRERVLGRKRSPDQDDHIVRDVRLTALENEQAEADKLTKEEAELDRPKTKGEQANEARRAKLEEAKKSKKAEEDRAEKRKEIEELKRKVSGQLTPEERADQELEDQLSFLKKEQEFERKRRPLNPQGESLTKLMGKRRF